MTSLVTGAAGFLGSHLVARLLREGHHVIALDNGQTGTWARLASLEASPGADRLRCFEHDVREPYHFEHVDRIWNLACPASPPHYQADPAGTTLTSVLGTLHGLQLAERTGARLLQASTSEVYGDPEVHPQPETYYGNVNPTGPRACYDEGKRVAESLLLDLHRTRGVAVRIARIFNTYGPGMALDDGRVVVNFVQQALRGEPLTVYGDGLQTRSLCYVDDLIDGLVALMEHPDRVLPVNLGNPRERSVLELAEHVRRLFPEASITHRPLPVDDPVRRQPDISVARELLGFTPRVGLEEGLRRTVDDLRHRLGQSERTSARRAHGLGSRTG